MAEALRVRSVSLAASTLTTGAVLLAAMTVSYTVHRVALREPPGAVMIREIPPEPPEPARKADPPPTSPGSDRLAISLPVEQFHPIAAVEAAAGSGTADLLEPFVSISDPHWVRRPRDLDHYYPRRAREAGIEGAVALDCMVSVAGALRCSVISETPQNWGFAAAAQRMVGAYQMVPASRDGAVVEGRYRMRIPFALR